jgi:hypothetical protein
MARASPTNSISHSRAVRTACLTSGSTRHSTSTSNLFAPLARKTWVRSKTALSARRSAHRSHLRVAASYPRAGAFYRVLESRAIWRPSGYNLLHYFPLDLTLPAWCAKYHHAGRHCMKRRGKQKSAGLVIPDDLKSALRRFTVQKKQCSTCICHNDSPLDPAALEDAVRDKYIAFKGYRECHHAKHGSGVCCRRFWNRHKDEFAAGQIAQRLGLVEFAEVSTLPETAAERCRPAVAAVAALVPGDGDYRPAFSGEEARGCAVPGRACRAANNGA